jgi:hypothetical protein
MLKIIAHFFILVNRFLRHIATFLRGREFFLFSTERYPFSSSQRKAEEKRKKTAGGRGERNGKTVAIRSKKSKENANFGLHFPCFLQA